MRFDRNTGARPVLSTYIRQTSPVYWTALWNTSRRSIRCDSEIFGLKKAFPPYDLPARPPAMTHAFLHFAASHTAARPAAPTCAAAWVCASWAEARRAAPPPIARATPFGAGNTPGVALEQALPLTVADLLAIVRGESADSCANEIVWTLLGWRWPAGDHSRWDGSAVDREWREAYPDAPPDFIGVTGVYTPSVDRPVKKAIQRLQRSIPAEHKNALRETLKPHGFAGWHVRDLTPNRTRRAACVNYILYWHRIHFARYQWK